MGCCPEGPSAKMLDQETALTRARRAREPDKRRNPSAPPTRDGKSPVFLLVTMRPCCPATEGRTSLRTNPGGMSKRVEMRSGLGKGAPSKGQGLPCGCAIHVLRKGACQGGRGESGDPRGGPTSWSCHGLSQLHACCIPEGHLFLMCTEGHTCWWHV